MKTPEQIGAEVKKLFSGEPGEFRPCAYFDDRLDCIRVIVRDCSVLETRVHERLTVLEDMYYPAGRKQYVGFTVKGARHFCRENGISLAAPIAVGKLLDAILAAFPEPAVQIFVNGVARELVKEEKIEVVDVSGALPQSA